MAHLALSHGTLVGRGTVIEKHWLKDTMCSDGLVFFFKETALQDEISTC